MLMLALSLLAGSPDAPTLMAPAYASDPTDGGGGSGDAGDGFQQPGPDLEGLSKPAAKLKALQAHLEKLLQALTEEIEAGNGDGEVAQDLEDQIRERQQQIRDIIEGVDYEDLIAEIGVGGGILIIGGMLVLQPSPHGKAAGFGVIIIGSIVVGIDTNEVKDAAGNGSGADAGGAIIVIPGGDPGGEGTGTEDPGTGEPDPDPDPEPESDPAPDDDDPLLCLTCYGFDAVYVQTDLFVDDYFALSSGTMAYLEINEVAVEVAMGVDLTIWDETSWVQLDETTMQVGIWSDGVDSEAVTVQFFEVETGMSQAELDARSAL